MGSVFFFNPAVLASCIPKIGSFAFHKDLKWPKSLKTILMFPILYILCVFTYESGYWIFLTNMKINFTFLVHVIASTINSIFISAVFSLPHIFLCSWIDKFSDLCKNTREEDFTSIRKRLREYKLLQSGLGNFLLYVYGSTQIFSVFTTYMIFSCLLGPPPAQFPPVVLAAICLGGLCITLGLVLNILGVTNTACEAKHSLTALAAPVRASLEVEPCRLQREKGSDFYIDGCTFFGHLPRKQL